MIDNKTERLELPLPNIDNYLEQDVDRLAEALTILDRKVATVGDDGKVPVAQLPAVAITDTFPVDSQEAMLLLNAQPGDVAIRSDVSKSFILMQAPASVLQNWKELLNDAVVRLTPQIRESQRRSYAEAGYTMVPGSFEDGGTITSDKDVLITSSGLGYSFAGEIPPDGLFVPEGSTPNAGEWVDRSNVLLRGELAGDGGAQIVKNSVRWFDSIQAMLAATDLELGQKVCTGASFWKIVTSSKGVPLSNGTQYALPLNGVWIDDAGADPTGVSDSYDAIMYVISLYNVSSRCQFSVNSNGGTYLVSAEIALHSQTSWIRFNFGGASLKATANMNAVFSCLAITGLRVKSLKLEHSTGVVITTAMMLINSESANTNKVTRVLIDDISAGLVTGSPQFIMCDKMWESEIRRIRVDFNVTGFTGRCIYLRSCVNVTVQPIDIEYAAEGVNLGKNTSVSYGCEGVTFNGGVIANCNVPVVGNYATAVRFIGTVMDFCNNSGPTFTNGQDVSLIGCWIANKSTSAAGWNGVAGASTFKTIKILGCHFVNNSASNCNCASLLSSGSSFLGNTASTIMLPGARAADVVEGGNTYGTSGIANYREKGASFNFTGDAGIAPSLTLNSGLTSANSNDLLSRVNLSAKGVNSSNMFNIDHLRGFAADIAKLGLGWNGNNGWVFNPANWCIEFQKSGGGLILKSPDGLTTKTLRLSNAGALELI